MSIHATLFYGAAEDIESLLYNVDPDRLDKSELVTALCNSFRQIELLQKQVQQLSSQVQGHSEILSFHGLELKQ